MLKLITGIALSILLSGCDAKPLPASSRAATNNSSPLVSSTPANGAIVKPDLEALVLRFEQAVRLNEVLLIGPGGMMPMMVTAPTEQKEFSIPLSGLEPGSHQVTWRATAGTEMLSGVLRFTVE